MDARIRRCVVPRPGPIFARADGDMRMVRPLVLALLVAGLFGHGVAMAAEPPSYLCAPAKVENDGSAPAALGLADRFTTREITVAKPASVCWATAPADATLEGYGVPSRKGKSRRVGAAIDLVTRFGRQSLTIRSLADLRVPSSANGADAASVLACYAVRRDRANGGRQRVTVTDASGERVFDVGRPVRVCVPPSGETAPELVCHALRLARTKPLKQAAAKTRSVTITTRFGTDQLRVRGARELCVPALGAPTDPPDTPPAFALEITPHEITVIAGSKTPLTATAQFMDGHVEDYTEAVAWSSSDESVARVVASSAGGVFLDPVGPGTAIISATDPVTGIGSADTDGNATVTVTWPLEKLVLSPHAATKRPGSYLGYTVIGWFTGGFTRNLTQKVVYTSSNPFVAAAPNTPGNRSRVQAHAKGITTISAVDPISGIGTTDSGNDATLRVTGALSYILVKSNLRYSSRFPGQSQRFTAIGYFNDGSSINLTQQCIWSSSDPSVAVATNPDGDRSRIDAVAPGVSYITCTDPVSGYGGGDPFWVLGELTNIEVGGASTPADWLRTGQTVSLTALGYYEGGGVRNLTQDVTWASRDPEIALATNEPGNRSRFLAIKGGNARAFATDVASGITSPDSTVRVLGDLLGLEIFGLYNSVLAVNQIHRYPVRAEFEYGTLNLALARLDYELQSSDPSVLEVLEDGVNVRGVAPGIAELTAFDEESGLTSPPATIRVKGGLDHITLTPATSTRGIGEWESFTGIGHYLPDLTELLTQRLTYASSDESVAIADNAPGERSKVRTVGAGTATITATEPFTGKTASSTITVLPGTIERVTIQPSNAVRNRGNGFSYTAIGHYPDGSTINVTQVCTWESLLPDVGEARNMPGDRSRVFAGSPGTAQIIARHPSGLSSHDSGDDAAFVVKPLVSLGLTPESHRGPVGMTEHYTLFGIFDDATTINLTQSAYYWTDDGTVARADNLEGDRSAVDLLSPGYTTVHATFADWTYGYPQFYGSVAGAFLAVEP
jgi:uncharacterized protein YjdB